MVQRQLHKVSGFFGVLVFPDAKDQPSRLGKRSGEEDVPGAGPCDLSAPPFSIRLGPRCMLGAAVPKTAVDEYRHLRPHEQYVWVAPHAGYGSISEAISVAPSV